MEMKWYTVYTRQNWEKRVADSLECKKICYFYPEKTISVASKKIKNPCFERFLFVRINESEITRLKKINGIINFLYWKNKPAIISDFEIDLIKKFIIKHIDIRVEKKEIGFSIPKYTTALQVHREGGLVDINNNKIKIILPSLGYLMVAELEKSKVKYMLRENILTPSTPSLTLA